MSRATHARGPTTPHNRDGSTAAIEIESASVIREIRSLLESAVADPPRRDLVERTLTNGYAHALRLDGKRLRIENTLRSALRGEAGGDVADLTVELAVADQELAHLRGLLSTLKSNALT